MVDEKLQIIPLGGLGEVGKNMTVFRYGDEILVVDAGLSFPEENMLGIDIVIPDTAYLRENRGKIKAIVLTHGHEDHIGALPYLLKEFDLPVYGTKLTLALLSAKLEERNLDTKARLIEVQARSRKKIGVFDVEFFHLNHSIPDVAGLGIHTPAGTIVYASDFKFDQTPVDGSVADLYKLAEFGERGVLALMSDSTNAERPGYTMSERVVGGTIKDIFQNAPSRILVATFASNVHRIQQVVDAAFECGRKIAVAGRSMVKVVDIASQIGYLNIPEGMLIELDEIDKLPGDRVAILATGSQGEAMAALSRIAMAAHKQIEIRPGDTVIIAATPVPGNEKTVARTIDGLFRRGAKVIYEAVSGVHVSGHASQEELKLMLNLTRPRFFIPNHGEYRMLVQHGELAKEVGIPEDNIFILENGDVLELSPESAAFTGKVTAGKVLVDGLGVGDVGNIVLRDRRQLSEDGILIVVLTLDKQSGAVIAGPEIISRGFVYVRESEALLEEARSRVSGDLAQFENGRPADWGSIKSAVRDSLGQFLYHQTGRRPMVLPIIMEV